jgi:hypothetical protein
MKKREPTFDRWVEKVFVGRPPSWNWMWENALHPRKAEWLVTYPTRLFHNPEFLIGRYSDKQLRKGFWNLPNSWELGDSIWTGELPWKLRKSCIKSMVPLFETFFLRKPLGDTCQMWWDLLRYFGDDREERVVDEMFLAAQEDPLPGFIGMPGRSVKRSWASRPFRQRVSDKQISERTPGPASEHSPVCDCLY